MRGFTLIELVVTVMIIAILASVIVPLAQVSVQHSKEQDLKLALREIRNGIDAYKQAGDEGHVLRSADASGYPASLQVLVQGVADARDPSGHKIYFLRRIPPDPMNTDDSLSPDATWGKRSYHSDADKPKPGEDVYDVYSLSTATGSDGRPYKDW